MLEQPQAGLDLDILPTIRAPYFDASVFIAHIEQELYPAFEYRPRIAITLALFEAARNKQFQIFTSFFTWAEVRRIRGATDPLEPHELIEITQLFNEFMEREYIVPIEVNREVGEKAQELGATYGISPTDAVHLASAIIAGCPMLFLWDKGWEEKFPTRECEGVKLVDPYWQGVFPPLPPDVQARLDAQAEEARLAALEEETEANAPDDSTTDEGLDAEAGDGTPATEDLAAIDTERVNLIAGGVSTPDPLQNITPEAAETAVVNAADVIGPSSDPASSGPTTLIDSPPIS